jgi:hypothetical protein
MEFNKMKKLDAIKIYCFNSVYTNKSLTKEEKLFKLQQIKESKTSDQVIKLLSEIPVISMDPQVQEVSSGMMLAVIILQHAYQKYVNAYKRLMVPCDEAPDQYKCKNKARLQSKELQLRTLLDHRGKCRSKGTPEQQKNCQDKVDEKIKLVKVDVQHIRAKLT